MNILSNIDVNTSVMNLQLNPSISNMLYKLLSNECGNTLVNINIISKLLVDAFINLIIT